MPENLRLFKFYNQYRIIQVVHITHNLFKKTTNQTMMLSITVLFLHHGVTFLLLHASILLTFNFSILIANQLTSSFILCVFKEKNTCIFNSSFDYPESLVSYYCRFDLFAGLIALLRIWWSV